MIDRHALSDGTYGAAARALADARRRNDQPAIDQLTAELARLERRGGVERAVL